MVDEYNPNYENERQLISDIVRGLVGIPEGSPDTWSTGDKALLAASVIPVSKPLAAGAKAVKAALPAAERLAIQGGALSSKPSLAKIARVLEDHDHTRFEPWELDSRGLPLDKEFKGNFYTETEDGIRAGVSVSRPGGGVGHELKTFKDNTHLGTLRDWLGY